MRHRVKTVNRGGRRLPDWRNRDNRKAKAWLTFHKASIRTVDDRFLNAPWPLCAFRLSAVLRLRHVFAKQSHAPRNSSKPAGGGDLGCCPGCPASPQLLEFRASYLLRRKVHAQRKTRISCRGFRNAERLTRPGAEGSLLTIALVSRSPGDWRRHTRGRDEFGNGLKHLPNESRARPVGRWRLFLRAGRGG